MKLALDRSVIHVNPVLNRKPVRFKKAATSCK